MSRDKKAFKGLLFVLSLSLLLVSAVRAQEGVCPQPRVEVANDFDFYDIPQRDQAGHYLLAMNAAVGNDIIALNSGDIRFFSSLTAAIPVGDVDYHLSIGSRPGELGLVVSIKMVDNNNRVVLTRRHTIDDPAWRENTNALAHQIAQEVSPIFDDIKDHQVYIRSTTEAAISSKFEPEQRFYTVTPEKKQKIRFVLKDCDETVLPDRQVSLELEGPGKIDKSSVRVDTNGQAEFTYTAPSENAKATIVLGHTYEDVAGNDNSVSVDKIDINTSGKLWLLVDHVSTGAEIIVVGEHIGQLEMMWNDQNTRGGLVAAFSDDEDEEIWSSTFIGFLEMKVAPAGEGIWSVSQDWYAGETKITSREQGGFEIEISWPLEGGGVLPVHGTITYNKPAGFDAARKKFLAAKRNRRS